MPVHGATETARAFRQLAAYTAGPLNQASKRSLAPTLVEAKALAPADTGTLRRSLVVGRVKDSPKTAPIYLVRPNSKTRGRDGRRPVKYAHLVEFGLGPVRHASRFLTRAFENTKHEVVRIFEAEFKPALLAQVKKVAARRAGPRR